MAFKTQRALGLALAATSRYTRQEHFTAGDCGGERRGVVPPPHPQVSRPSRTKTCPGSEDPRRAWSVWKPSKATPEARGPLKEFPGLQGCNFDHVRPLEDLDREMTGTHFAIAADTRTTLCGLPPPHLRTGARVLTTAGRLHL